MEYLAAILGIIGLGLSAYSTVKGVQSSDAQADAAKKAAAAQEGSIAQTDQNLQKQQGDAQKMSSQDAQWMQLKQMAGISSGLTDLAPSSLLSLQKANIGMGAGDVAGRIK